MWQLATAIAAVRVLTDLMKRLMPNLTAREIQALVLVFSVGGGFLVAGAGDVRTLVTAIGAVFAGAIAFYEILQKR
jgi:hypothetical protein